MWMRIWQRIIKDSALGIVYTIVYTSVVHSVVWILYTTHSSNVECYHLYLLLYHIRTPSSYSYLKTVHNILYSTLQSACKVLGLL